jgi:hypothetical protein
MPLGTIPEPTPEEQPADVAMIGSDGKIYDVPAANVEAAKAGGWIVSKPETSVVDALNQQKAATITEETQQSIADHEQQTQEMMNDQIAAFNKGKHEEYLKQNTPGALITGLTSFGNEAALGLPDKYAVSLGLRTPEEQELRERSKEEHPYASGIGSTAGFLTSAYAGGEVLNPLAKAAEGSVLLKGVAPAGESLWSAATKAAEAGVAQGFGASYAGKVAAKAASSAIVGAGFSAPEAIIQSFQGDYAAAGESVAIGIGLGGLMGATEAGVLAPAWKGFKELPSKIGTVPNVVTDWLNERQTSGMRRVDEFVMQDLGITKKGLKKIDVKGAEIVSNFVSDIKKDGKSFFELSRKDRFEEIENIRKDTGKKLGAFREEFEKYQNELPPEKQFNKNDVYKRADELTERLSPELIRQSPNMVNMKNFVNELLGTPAIEDGLGNIIVDAKKGVLEHFLGENELSTPVNLNKAQKLTEMLRERALGFKGDFTNVDSKTKKDIMFGLYNIVDNELNRTMNNIAEAKLAPDKYVDFISNNRKYAATKMIQNYGANKFDAVKASSMMKGAISYGLGGAILHGPIGAVQAFGVKVAQNAVADWWHKTGSAKALSIAIKASAGQDIFGALIAKDGMDRLAQHIDNIPQMIKDISHRSIVRAIPEYRDPIGVFLGDKAKGTKDQQFAAAAKIINSHAANPDALVRSLEPVATILSKSSPNLAAQYVQTALNAAAYLHSTLPRNPNPPQPFQKDTWKPTEAQKQDFADRVEIVNNPMAAIKHAIKGTLSKAHIQTSATVYPSLHQKQTTEIVNAAFSGKLDAVPYQTRLQLSKFTGGILDPSLKNLSAIQQNYQVPAATGGSAPPGRTKGGKAATSHMPSLQTDVQRRSYGSYSKS